MLPFAWHTAYFTPTFQKGSACENYRLFNLTCATFKLLCRKTLYAVTSGTSSADTIYSTSYNTAFEKPLWDNLRYDVSPWYWSFRRHLKRMWWWARLEIPWCGASQHTAFQTNLWEDKLVNTSGPSRFTGINWLFICWKQWSTASFTNCFMDCHVIWSALLHLRHCSDLYTICSDRCTTALGQQIQTHYNRFRWIDSKGMKLQCIIIAFYITRKKYHQKLLRLVDNWSNLTISHYFPVGYFDRWLSL